MDGQFSDQDDRWTDEQRQAIELAGGEGGAYLESIGKTDLATLDADQWKTFLMCVVGGYFEHNGIIQAAAAKDKEGPL